MRRTRLLLICLIVARIVPAEGVGTVVAADDVTLVRDGKPIVRQIDAEFRVEHFDAFTTGAFGLLAIDVDPATGIDASVTADRHSELALDISDRRSAPSGTIELVAGSTTVSMAPQVGKEAESRVRVRAGEIVAEARAGEFAVTVLPDGRALVVSGAGIIAVAIPDGGTRYARPGVAVEFDEVTSLARVVRHAPGSPTDVVAAWRAAGGEPSPERVAGALTHYSQRYPAASGSFSVAYAELMRHRGVIDAWIDESMRGFRPEFAATEPGPDDLVRALGRARAAMHRYEWIAAALEGLERAGALVTQDVNLEETDRLFELLELERPLMRERAATVRHALKLYADRNAGVAPSPEAPR